MIGFIYGISCNITHEVYIGSTFLSVSQRLAKHCYDYKNYIKGKYHYTTSFKIIERGDYSINLIETVEVNSVYELRLRERHHYDMCDTRINKNRPVRLEGDKDEKAILKYKQEYYKKNKDKIAKIYEKNKDKIAENYEKNKDKIAENYEKNKEAIAKKHQEYYNKNKDKIAKKQQEYREKNKEKIAQKYQQAKIIKK